MLGISKLALRTFKPMVTIVRGKYPITFHQMLQLLPDVNCTRMENGLCVVSEERPGINHVCVGIFVDGGSRYENQFENGITHFFEHLIFQGTACRSSAVIEKIMRETGARFNCFTEREFCGYYARCCSEDLNIIVDLLSDCVFSNRPTLEAIELQKSIVYQEMEDYDTNYNAVLMDYLHSAAFVGTPLANTVMGPSHNLQKFCHKTLCSYLSKVFEPTRTVLAAVGGINHNQLLELGCRYLLRFKPRPCYHSVYRFTAGDVRFRDDALPLCNTAIAWEAPPFGDELAYTMKVAAAYIGGWDNSQPGGPMCSSKLARAAHSGLAHSVKSFYFQYRDTGLFGIQFMPPRKEVDDYLLQVADECMQMCTMATYNEVTRCKREVKTHLMTRYENLRLACIDLARHTLYCGSRPSLSEQLQMVDYVTDEDFKRICSHFLYNRCPAVAAVGPCEQLHTYPRLSSNFYWLRL